MKGKKAHKAAEQEAFEEAGLIGRVDAKPLGVYKYWKRGTAAFELCAVTVYSFHVEAQASHWREQGQRRAQWFTLDEAEHLVDEPGLKVIIQGLQGLQQS